MEDDRIPKQLMYSQLDSGHRNVGRPWLRYKDKLKSNLAAVRVDMKNFESLVNDRGAWRAMCKRGLKHFSRSCIDKLREDRIRTGASAKRPAAHSSKPHACDHCGLLCKSLAGLKCHIRLKKCRRSENT